MAEKKLNILADFPAVSTEAWMAKVTADLKGADFNKRLVWKTAEGFDVMPLYRAENIEGMQSLDSAPGKFPFVRGTKADNHWFVRQEVKAEEAKEANAEALEALENGVNSLGFKIPMSQLSAQYIADLLKDIKCDAIELNFRICVSRAEELVKTLAEYFKSQNYKLEALQGSINFDPINRALTHGTRIDAEFIKTLIVPLVKTAKILPAFRVVNVNAVSLNNAGAYSAQELGYALAWGEQYISLMAENGVDVADACKALKFNFGVGGNYFMEIAKFRAARLLWAKIVEAYHPQCNCEADCKCMEENGVDFCPCSAKMHIHAQTSLFNMTIFDAHVNMLRSQTEAMSAAIAGVNSLTVTPFDITYQTPDKFAERIAKNQQLLLKEESHFDKIVDASAGSYYIENLTEKLAEEAWKIFIACTEEGFLNMVLEGKIQRVICQTSEDRLKKLASRREILLGTNQFPNFTEMAAKKISIKEETCGCPAEKGLPTLPHYREAQQFEELRLATEHSAHRPKVFMLTIGNLAMRLARAQFSSNFFACAGYEIIDNLGFKTIAEGVESARKAQADIIVLCSSDDEYATLAPEAFETIAGKEIFVVAGAPACMEDLQKVGIENFIHVKTNVLEALKGFNSKLLK